MKRSKILMIAAAAALLILLITAVAILKGDGTGPSITIPSGIEYHKGMSDSELLNGVTAEDSKDGDVSDTLIVESVIILSSGDSVKITYAAKDKHNNITQKSIILPYNAPAEKPTKSQEATKPADIRKAAKRLAMKHLMHRRRPLADILRRQPRFRQNHLMLLYYILRK